jgi:hypothetical protein
MIERVARAMHEDEGGEEPLDGYRRLARVAIAAMREATDDQRSAYFAMARREGHTDISACFNDGTWERMIDAALTEPVSSAPAQGQR